MWWRSGAGGAEQPAPAQRGREGPARSAGGRGHYNVSPNSPLPIPPPQAREGAKAGLRRVAPLALALLLAGCGFHPLYSPPAMTTSDPRLAAIQVPQIPERTGQRLTIALRDAFNPNGATVDPRYRLHVTLASTRRDTAIRQDGTATRAEIAVTATYSLVGLEDGRTALSGTARSSSSVDLVENEYANVVAQDDARMRAIDELAVELQTRCAMFMGRPATAAK